MNRMMTILSVFVGMGFQTFALAGASEMDQFFRMSEGQWEGKGTRRALQVDGTYSSTRFTVETEVVFQREKNWNTRTELTTEFGIVEPSSGSFAIRGEQLFVGTYSPSEPVSVLESSAHQLTFGFRRIALFPPRVFDFSISQRFVDQDHIQMRQEVRFNDVVILEEETQFERD